MNIKRMDITLPRETLKKVIEFIFSTGKFEYNEDFGFSAVDDLYSSEDSRRTRTRKLEKWPNAARWVCFD